jgi:hypothetical protein
MGFPTDRPSNSGFQRDVPKEGEPKASEPAVGIFAVADKLYLNQEASAE